MFRTRLALPLFLLCLLVSLSAYAQQTKTVVVERPVIVTPIPAPKETIVTPEGYVTCFTVKAGWYQDVWAADHRVCQYANSPSGVVWVEGYWVCNKYNTGDGQCTNWEWKPAHWEKQVVVY